MNQGGGEEESVPTEDVLLVDHPSIRLKSRRDLRVHLPGGRGRSLIAITWSGKKIHGSKVGAPKTRLIGAKSRLGGARAKGAKPHIYPNRASRAFNGRGTTGTSRLCYLQKRVPPR